MLGYLRLVRLPNVFTAIADVVAAYTAYATVNHGALTAADFRGMALLALASAFLYLAGMALNDLADRAEDAMVRPNRPIPSGQVSLTGAAACGFGLMLLGIVLAALQGDSWPLAVALAFSILAYDFASKGITILGPVTLGLCRFFNVAMGSAAGAGTVWGMFKDHGYLNVPLALAFSVGIYAAGLTAFSAQEESGKQIRSILTGWIFCGAALAIAGIFGQSFAGWIALGPLTLLLVVRTVQLAKAGTPLAARNLVRTGVMGVCALDAGLVLSYGGSENWPAAVACVALLLPAIIIAKWLAQKEA
jgi:4-hydroxybenzoate polyprenyltransferase